MKNLSPFSSSQWLAPLVGLLLLAFGLRVAGLDSRSLWFDESIEYWMASVPFAEVYLAVSEATHDPPLFSYLMLGWQKLGIQEFWLRLPTLFTSILGIVGTAVLAARAINRNTGLIAALLLTFAAADIRYAQELGQYAVMVCLVAWNLLFLLMAYQQDRWRWWLLWGATAVLNIYTHYGTALVIFATALVVLLTLVYGRRWPAVQKMVLCSALAVILILPLVFIVMPRQMGRLAATPRPFSMSQFALISTRILVFQFMGNEAILRWPWTAVPNWLPALPVLIALPFGLRHKNGRTLLLWLAAAWFVYYLVGLTGTYFFDSTRHSLLLTPLIMVTIAIGLVTIWQQNRYAATLLLLIILTSTQILPREAEEDLQTAVALWQQQVAPDDITYIYYGAAPAFGYRLDNQVNTMSRLPRQWYRTCWQPGDDPAFCQSNGVYYGNWTRANTPETLTASLLDTLGTWPNRLWLVFAHVHESEDATFLKTLEPLYDVAYQETLEGASLYLVTKR